MLSSMVIIIMGAPVFTYWRMVDTMFVIMTRAPVAGIIMGLNIVLGLQKTEILLTGCKRTCGGHGKLKMKELTIALTSCFKRLLAIMMGILSAQKIIVLLQI